MGISLHPWTGGLKTSTINASVLLEGQKSKRFVIGRGVRQGSFLSPTLLSEKEEWQDEKWSHKERFWARELKN